MLAVVVFALQQTHAKLGLVSIAFLLVVLVHVGSPTPFALVSSLSSISTSMFATHHFVTGKRFGHLVSSDTSIFRKLARSTSVLVR